MLAHYLRGWHTTDPTHTQCDTFPPSKHDALTQLLVQCWAGVVDDGPLRTTFIQRQPIVSDVGPALYKCYTNALRLLGFAVLIPPSAPEHTRSIDPVLDQNWASDADGRPTLKQHRAGVFSLLRLNNCKRFRRYYPSIGPYYILPYEPSTRVCIFTLRRGERHSAVITHLLL